MRNILKSFFRNKTKNKFYIVASASILILIIYFCIIFRVYSVGNDAMYGNIAIGTIFNKSDIERGDVVLAIQDNKYVIRRIIGLPGDTIDINYGTYTINDSEVDEPYLPVGESTYSSIHRFELQENQYFIMADNRDNYEDSRTKGCISKENIVQRIILIL